MERLIIVVSAIVLTLLAPFVLRPDDDPAGGRSDERIVVITPHHESICREFGRAFTEHFRQQTGRTVEVDWRIPGGTSEIARVLNSEYRNAFENHWRRTLGLEWSDEVAAGFNDRKLEVPEDPKTRSVAQQAKAIFLASNVGIGIDLFFGGGPYDFQQQADRGHLVAADPTGQHGPAAVAHRRPEWFSDDIIPARVSGEDYYDPQFRWIGTCLSSFGIVYNNDSLRRLGIARPPVRWDDLGSPAFRNEIALADPTKSGSVTKAFEMLLQEKIQNAVRDAPQVPGQTPEEIRGRTIREGWTEGLRLIQRIAANARYFTDDATKIPRDVAAGISAAGMCIDFYGRSTNERHLRDDGTSRVGYVTPIGGSSTSVDPIGMLRGAPNPDLASAFIEFVLSKEGQKLWDFRAGTPGGPENHALRRLPIRKDLYTPEFLPFFADPDVMPYASADAFVYEPEYTARAFNSIRFIIKVMCVDCHDELRTAWEALVEAGFPRRATQLFHDVEIVHYDAACGTIAERLASPERILESRMARDLADTFRHHYRTTVEMAQRGE